MNNDSMEEYARLFCKECGLLKEECACEERLIESSEPEGATV